MPGVIESPFIGGVTCLNASPIYQVVEAQRRMDCLVHHEMQYVRMRLQRSVSQVLWLNDFYGSEAILLDAAASMKAPCLHSMHAHFLDMQRSPPRKRPLLYPIHVCTCNPIHVCTCNNASWPSTPSTRRAPATSARRAPSSLSEMGAPERCIPPLWARYPSCMQARLCTARRLQPLSLCMQHPVMLHRADVYVPGERKA